MTFLNHKINTLYSKSKIISKLKKSELEKNITPASPNTTNTLFNVTSNFLLDPIHHNHRLFPDIIMITIRTAAIKFFNYNTI